MLYKKAKFVACNLSCRDTLLPSATVCYRASTYNRMGGGENPLGRHSRSLQWLYIYEPNWFSAGQKTGSLCPRRISLIQRLLS